MACQGQRGSLRCTCLPRGEKQARGAGGRPYLKHDDADLFDALDDGLWDPSDGDGSLGRVGQHVSCHLDLCPRALQSLQLKIGGQTPGRAVTSATNPVAGLYIAKTAPLTPSPQNKVL